LIVGNKTVSTVTEFKMSHFFFLMAKYLFFLIKTKEIFNGKMPTSHLLSALNMLPLIQDPRVWQQTTTRNKIT
jgi:hypothetical protein